jgi:hypothetical protein
VAEFLVELYVSRAHATVVEHGAERARLAAEQLIGEGTEVRLLRSIFVPEDETCFLLYEADSADAVREAALRADLPFDRIAEVHAEPGWSRAGKPFSETRSDPDNSRPAKTLRACS